MTGYELRIIDWSSDLCSFRSCGGTNLCPGDVVGSGTISRPSREMFGSMFELCNMGELPLTLPNGETHTFLEDGDEVSFSARCERAGFAPLGFGSCEGRIVSALPM